MLSEEADGKMMKWKRDNQLSRFPELQISRASANQLSSYPDFQIQLDLGILGSVTALCTVNNEGLQKVEIEHGDGWLDITDLCIQNCALKSIEEILKGEL